MKIIDDILKEVDLEVIKKAPHAQRKYNKITETLKVKFLHKIYQENKSIKQAAEQLNINYSSAKTILTMHRKKSNSNVSPSCDQMPIPKANIDFKANSQNQMLPSLPPKHLAKQSFMSTASNLSGHKDQEESCSQNQDETNLNLTPNQLTLNNNSVLVASLGAQNVPFSFSQNFQPQQKNFTLVTPPPQQLIPSDSSNYSQQNLLIQLQHYIQAQQHQQQLSESIQQLLILQLAQQQQQLQEQQQTLQQPLQINLTAQFNPLTTLLLQQLLLNQATSSNIPIEQKLF